MDPSVGQFSCMMTTVWILSTMGLSELSLVFLVGISSYYISIALTCAIDGVTPSSCQIFCVSTVCSGWATYVECLGGGGG